MFTPQEVSEKTFPKASGFNNGYGMAAVDEFLDALTEDYTALYKDNAALKAKLKVLAEKVEEYRATEDAMRSTLLSAQRMAAQMVSDAQAQRDKMPSDEPDIRCLLMRKSLFFVQVWPHCPPRHERQSSSHQYPATGLSRVGNGIRCPDFL